MNGSRQLISRLRGTVELDAFVDRVVVSVHASDAVASNGVAQAVKDLSTTFDPCWPDTEKLAWLFVTNLLAMPAPQKRLVLDVAEEAVAVAIAASADDGVCRN